jgi:hypothetical protein
MQSGYKKSCVSLHTKKKPYCGCVQKEHQHVVLSAISSTYEELNSSKK